MTSFQQDAGSEMYELAKRLWPINRSLTGNGVRKTLHLIREMLPILQIHEIPSGTQIFDWTIPNEWNVREAWIEGPDGQRVVDFFEHNLHLVGYSIPIDVTLNLEELQRHLYSLPDQPNAIPYLTSYYDRRWGFCMRHCDRMRLEQGKYHVHIDASLEPGFLTYGELVLPGETDKEVLLSTYICHPSMANNELSGPCVTAFLARWLSGLPKRRYTYRIIFIPETLGSIAYLSKNIERLKQHVIAGFNITCIGDDRCYSYLPSRAGDTLSDKVALHVLKHIAPDFKQYSYLDRGSDERQYCAPGIDLPIASIMRSKYSEYPEYHTSLDDLNFVTQSGLEGGFIALQKAIEIIEHNCIPRNTILCEPQLGKRGLYPTLSTKAPSEKVRVMMDLIAYCDGSNSLLDIAKIIGVLMTELIPTYQLLLEHGVLVSYDKVA
jgi:aminopeptidase-like protein